MSIYVDMWNKLKDTPGNILRKEALEMHFDAFSEFKNLFKYAYEPNWNYYMKKIGVQATKSSEELDMSHLDVFFSILDDLRKRVITGNTAIARVKSFLVLFAEEEQELLLAVIKKDMKCKCGKRFICDIDPHIIKVFQPMLASEWNLKKVLFPCLGNYKYDGIRVLAQYDKANKKVILLSRKGKELNKFNKVKEQLLAWFKSSSLRIDFPWDAMMFDGELYGKDFKTIQNNTMRKNSKMTDEDDIKFVIFDAVPSLYFFTAIKKDFNTPLSMRMDMLKSANIESANVEVVENTVLDNKKELDEFYDLCLEKGAEGIIVKDPDSAYKFKRSSAWIKRKPVLTVDLMIDSMLPGKEGTDFENTLGALVCKGEGIDVNVGSGLSVEDRDEMWNNPGRYIGKTVEVAYDAITTNAKNPEMKSLRFPRLVGIRDDK